MNRIRFELGESSQKAFVKDGKHGLKTEQECFVHHPGDRYPLTTKISIKDGEQPYPPGFYQLAKGSFKANQYGGLELSPFGIRFEPEDDAKPEPKPVSKAV